jgi:hypothetical protein
MPKIDIAAVPARKGSGYPPGGARTSGIDPNPSLVIGGFMDVGSVWWRHDSRS